MTAKDPYRYFRVEGRELLDGLVKGALDLEKTPAGKESIARLLRLAHTLKGAARVVKQPATADLAHELEERLAHLSQGKTAGREQIDELLAMLDKIGARLKALDPVHEPGAEPRLATGAPPDTVRIQIGEMDGLLQGIAATGVHLTALRQQAAQFERTVRLADLRAVERLARGFSSGIDQVERELLQVRDNADRLRLVPASTVFDMLERALRDAARSLDKRAELHAIGGEQRVDAHVLSKVSEALPHLVRNAIAHGIEGENDRCRAGKPAVGLVELTVERRGSRMAFVCRDDGRGIDVEAVRTVAIQRGLASVGEAQALDLDRMVQLLLKGGLSTTQVANVTSGRGLGLDIVRARVEELRGEIAVSSTPGRGTTVELSVPVSLSSVSALVVEAGGLTVSIPLTAVLRVVRVQSAEILHSAARASIRFEDQSIPFVLLAHALAGTTSDSRARASTVLVIRSAGSLTAVGVD